MICDERVNEGLGISEGYERPDFGNVSNLVDGGFGDVGKMF